MTCLVDKHTYEYKEITESCKHKVIYKCTHCNKILMELPYQLNWNSVAKFKIFLIKNQPVFLENFKRLINETLFKYPPVKSLLSCKTDNHIKNASLIHRHLNSCNTNHFQDNPYIRVWIRSYSVSWWKLQEALSIRYTKTTKPEFFCVTYKAA